MLKLKSFFLFLIFLFSGATLFAQVNGQNYGNENSPLYIMVFKKKMYELNNGTSKQIDLINPTSLQKIEILKDAKATAVYGYRGAYGVIAIEIKKEHAKKEFKRLRPYLRKL